MECRICDAKDTGLTNLPSHSFAINTAWLPLVLIAADLLAWTKTLCLDGELATAEPKRLRYTPAPNRGARPLSAAHHTAAGRRLAMGHRPGRRVHPTPRMVPSTQLKHPPPLQPRPPPPHRWCTTPRNRPPRTHQTIRSPTTTRPTPSQARTTTHTRSPGSRQHHAKPYCKIRANRAIRDFMVAHPPTPEGQPKEELLQLLMLSVMRLEGRVVVLERRSEAGTEFLEALAEIFPKQS